MFLIFKVKSENDPNIKPCICKFFSFISALKPQMPTLTLCLEGLVLFTHFKYSTTHGAFTKIMFIFNASFSYFSKAMLTSHGVTLPNTTGVLFLKAY